MASGNEDTSKLGNLLRLRFGLSSPELEGR